MAVENPFFGGRLPAVDGWQWVGGVDSGYWLDSLGQKHAPKNPDIEPPRFSVNLIDEPPPFLYPSVKADD